MVFARVPSFLLRPLVSKKCLTNNYIFNRNIFCASAVCSSFNDTTRGHASTESSPQTKGSSLQLSPRDSHLVKLLLKHDFNDYQIDCVREHLSKARFRNDYDLKVIQESLDFWKQVLRQPTLQPGQFITQRVESPEKIDARFVDVNYVVSIVEPDLLLVCPEAMRQRIVRFKAIGYMKGQSDIWQIFATAPRGYFLQDWTEFQRKYHYLQFRIMDWLIDNKREKYPDPHPLVEFGRVFEMSYDHIKARFLFAVKTGYKSATMARKVETSPKILNLGQLMLTELDQYLKLVAPFCTEEEYLVFEQMVADTVDEDDEIIDSLSELTNLENENSKNQARKRARKDGDKKETLRLVQLDH